MSKREAVPKHSLPPQKQILSYMGRFINCPYAPDTEVWRVCLILLCQYFVLLHGHHSDAVFALTVDTQTERLHIFIPP